MIIPIQIDPWTRRNFHHAPVSMKFVSLRNPFRRTAPERLDARGYYREARSRTIVPDIRPYIEFHVRFDEYLHRTIIYANLRRSFYPPQQYDIFQNHEGIHGRIREFNETLGMQINHEARTNIEVVKKDMVEMMQDKFAKSFLWEDPRPIIQRYNRENWRNMA